MEILIEPKRRQQILTLALPIIGGMVSQNVLNLVDTAMVGMLGAAALAAVGMASFANFMASAFITGLSAGVQAMAARRLGEGRTTASAEPLNGGLLLAVGLALPLSGIPIFFADEIFGLLVDDPEVVVLGVPYFQARLFAMVALGINFAFRGYWNGVNMSKIYMRTLLVMHASNIALNWVLIFGHLGLPALGVAGAGIGSAIATFIGSGLYLIQGWRMARANGFLQRLPSRGTMLTMLRLSVPTGISCCSVQSCPGSVPGWRRHRWSARHWDATTRRMPGPGAGMLPSSRPRWWVSCRWSVCFSRTSSSDRFSMTRRSLSWHGSLSG